MILLMFPKLFLNQNYNLQHSILIQILLKFMQKDYEQKLLKDNQQNSFSIYLKRPNNKDKPLHQLIISQDQIKIQQEGKLIEKLNLKDVIGFNDQKQKDDIYKITINIYAKKKKFLRSLQRYTQSYKFWTIQNELQYQKLKIILLKAITRRNVTKSTDEFKIMIYFNPNAGKNSKKHFDNVIDFISLTNLSFDVLETNGRGHCQNHANNLDTTKYIAAVIISGDGLMHQYVNSKAVIHLPVTHVPAGSGNAFAKTQSSLAGEDCTDQIAIFLIVKGVVKDLNLGKMELQNHQQPIYSMLSLEWAFLADIDMNSQFLRFLGGFRFQVYSVYRVIALRSYPGKLTYSTTKNVLPPLNQQINDPQYKTIESNFYNALFCQIPYISDKYNFAPLIKAQQELIDMQFLTQEHGRWQLIKYLLNSDSGSHFDLQKQTIKQGFNFGHGLIKSYRLEPTGQGQQKGIFGIDGQRYQAQKIQVSLSDRKVRTFV